MMKKSWALVCSVAALLAAAAVFIECGGSGDDPGDMDAGADTDTDTDTDTDSYTDTDTDTDSDSDGDTDSDSDAAGLTDNCFNWPAEEFSPTNSAGDLSVSVVEGQPAIDFTLKDVEGQSHTLFELLETRPVLLVFGAYT